MENAQTILVICLSAALAVFLILGIILLSICIKIANHIKHISEKAEQITDKAENIADFFSKAATPMAIGRIISQVSEAVLNRKGKKRKD
ncbi:MAG TPA: hypothetical protein VK694_04845 [Verrucomicrobiae bacterium]|nr:hypothetical protein [Verrucomicrobiae bacterium]